MPVESLGWVGGVRVCVYMLLFLGGVVSLGESE